MIVTLAAPWLGRTALNWIVDMSSVGVSVAFLATSLVAVKFFSKGAEKNMVYVVFGVLGAIISVVFLVLLLFPGSPAALTMPSLIALAAWIVLGIIFFMTQFKKINAMTKEELDYLILGQENGDKIE